MGKFDKLLREVSETEEPIEPVEIDDGDSLPVDELDALDAGDDLDPIEDDGEEFDVGSLVTVVDASSFTAEELELDEEDFEEFQAAVEAELTAVVFDVDDDDPNLVDIVYESGLEVFKIPKLMLNLVIDEDDADLGL
jgi:hypothetical protein